MLREYIGQVVDVVIDRPLGSPHPKFEESIYEVNYGFVPNTISGDGEEIDVYVLRVDKPLKKFRGKVVAVVKRLDDVEEKLVVMPIDNCENVEKDEISRKINFLEKYFKSEILTGK